MECHFFAVWTFCIISVVPTLIFFFVIFIRIFVIIVAVINTLVSVKDFRYSREVLYRPVGIYAKFSPVGGYVGMLIYNILFGGIVGIAGSIYAFVVRSFVVNNELQFAQIEQQFMAQAQ